MTDSLEMRNFLTDVKDLHNWRSEDTKLKKLKSMMATIDSLADPEEKKSALALMRGESSKLKLEQNFKLQNAARELRDEIDKKLEELTTTDKSSEDNNQGANTRNNLKDEPSPEKLVEQKQQEPQMERSETEQALKHEDGVQSGKGVSAQPGKPQGSNGSVGVKSAFPIDFSLYDENLHYVLYITDDPSKDQKLKVELKNTSGQEIDLTPDKSNFELRFRKGVLSDRTLGILRPSTPELGKLSILSDADQAIWDVSLNETIADDKHAISLTFRNTQSTPIPLLPDSALTLNLQNISADAGSGARGTRVVFIPREMIFNSGNNTPVTGNREQHLFITNHSGQKQIPLHVGFVGSNKILNDGQSESTLTLRIQNVAKPSQNHFETTAITFKERTSQFIISFDVQKENEDKPWAMCRANELKITAEPKRADMAAAIRTGLKLKAGSTEKMLKKAEDATAIANAEIQIDDPSAGQGQSPELKMTFQQPVSLNPGDYIEVELSGFQSSLPAGFAHMYLNYNNIPGYWDGHFILTIEKTPLLFRGVKDEDGNFTDDYVGIGTANPLNKLHVRMPGGSMGFGEAIRIETWGTEYKGYRGGGIITQHDGNITAGMYGLEEKQNSAQGALAFFTRIDKGDNEDFEDEFGISLTEKMRITSDGKVGIGTNNPGAKLEVNLLDTDTGTKSLIIGKGTTNYLTILNDGNLGIGTTSPSAKLEISAKLKATKADDTLVAVKIAPSFNENNQTGVKKYGLLVTDGNVGIGTISPGAKVEIAANLTAAKDDDILIGLKVSPTFNDNGKKNVKRYGLLVTDGNVGIGEASPTSKLQIKDTAANRFVTFTGPDTWAEVNVISKDVTAMLQAWGGGSKVRFGSRSDHSLQLTTKDTTRLEIDTNGNVALSGTLKVEGDVSITGSLKPNYDSGWVNDDNKTQHQKIFKHGLKAIPSLLTIQFSPDKVNVYPLMWPWNGSEKDRSDKSGNPLSIVMNTESVILNISSGDYLHIYWDANDPEGMQKWSQGYWRVLAWK